MQPTYRMRTIPALSVILAFIAVLVVITWGLFSQTMFAGGVSVAHFGWYVYAFTSGVFLFGSSAVLPFALTVIPMATKRRLGTAVVLTFAFCLGVLMTLVASGFFAGLVGLIGFDVFSFSTDSIARVGMLALGAVGYLLALSEVDLVRIARSQLSSRVTSLLARTRGGLSSFALGVFLSIFNVHPAALLLLGGVVLSGDPLHGAALLLMHAVGRIIPLLIVLSTSAIGENVSDWIDERKERMRLLLGWIVIGVAGLLINSALTDFVIWFGFSPLVLQFFHDRFALAILWLVPLWVLYFMESRRVYGSPIFELRSYERAIDRIEHERRALVHMLHFKDSENESHVIRLENQIDVLMKKRRIIESGLRHSVEESLRGTAAQRLEERLLMMRFAFTVAASLLVTSVLSLFSI